MDMDVSSSYLRIRTLTIQFLINVINKTICKGLMSGLLLDKCQSSRYKLVLFLK